MMPWSACLCVLWLLVSTVATEDVGSSALKLGGLLGGSSSQVDVIVSQVVNQSLAGCHLVLATTTDEIQVFFSMLQRLVPLRQTTTIVDARGLFSEDQGARDTLLHGMWGDARTSCQALILYIGTSNDKLPFRFLEASGLWLLPETPAVIIGGHAIKESILDHPSLRNTVHILYLTLNNVTHRKEPPDESRLMGRNLKEGVGDERVSPYRRCLYCNNGEMGVQLYHQLNMPSHVRWHDILFSDKLQNLMGHTLRVVTKSYFPFIDYQHNSSHPDGPLSPLDALDTRILNAFAARLNFTYEMREPWDKTWGVPLGGGNWSGIVGTLQHHQADFSLNLTPSAPRMKVISHSCIYTYDPLLILSLKPRPLPRHLALTRPFLGEVWITIIICTSVSGVILWLLQKGWSWVSGYRSIRFAPAIFHSWGLLLEEPSTYNPINISGQVGILSGFSSNQWTLMDI